MRLSEFQIFLVLIGAVVLLRFPTFFDTVIDHDESTYIVIASEILKGKQLYTDLIDLKPPGVFWFLALFYKYFEDKVLVARLLSAILIGLTGYLLYRSKINMGSHRWAALTAPFLYFFMTNFHFGLSFNTEYLMGLSAAICLFFYSTKPRVLGYFTIGLVGGLGFVIKYLALFDFASLFLFFIIWYPFFIRKNTLSGTFPALVPRAFFLATGFLIPFVLVNVYFYWTGQYHGFQFITFEAPRNYVAIVGWSSRLKYILDFHVAYLGFLIPFYWVVFNRNLAPPFVKMQISLGLIWFLSVLFSIQATGKLFDHYWLQLCLPVSFLAASVFEVGILKMPVMGIFNAKPVFRSFLPIGLITLGSVFNFFDYYIEPDPEAELASYLQANLQEGDIFYPANTSNILYAALNQEPLTPYVHSSLMVNNGHIRTLNIDTRYWIHKIMAQEVKYIIVDQRYPIEAFQTYISNDYFPVKQFGKKLILYERC